MARVLYIREKIRYSMTNPLQDLTRVPALEQSIIGQCYLGGGGGGGGRGNAVLWQASDFLMGIITSRSTNQQKRIRLLL